MITTIELKQHPAIRDIIRAAFPDYKKHRAMLSAFGEHGVRINSYWDGGSKDEYAIVDLATRRREALPNATHPYFEVAARGLANKHDGYVEVDHVGNITLKCLPEGFALIRSGWFCGKPATAHVYLNPANLTPLLPAA